MCTFVLAKNFELFFAKTLHLSFSPLEWHWVQTFRCQKRCTLRNSSPFVSPSFCFCQMAWHGIEATKQTIEFPAAPSFFSSKKWIKLIPKTIGNRKRDCAWDCARRINTTWENLQIEKHKSGRRSFRSPDWFVLFDLQIFSGGVYPPSATSRTISFSFPIVFFSQASKTSTLWVMLKAIHTTGSLKPGPSREILPKQHVVIDDDCWCDEKKELAMNTQQELTLNQ